MEDKKTEVSPWRRAYGVTDSPNCIFPATRRLLPINVCGNGYAPPAD